jgi:hypothetical protein
MVDKRLVVNGKTLWQAWLVVVLGFGKTLASKLGDGKGKILPQVRSLDDEVSAKPSSEMGPAPAAVAPEPESCARRKKSFFSWRKIGINNKIVIQSTKVPEIPLEFSSSSSAEGGTAGAEVVEDYQIQPSPAFGAGAKAGVFAITTTSFLNLDHALGRSHQNRQNL